MHANEKIELTLKTDGELSAAVNDLCKKIDPNFVT
jgi:hypothetical protein